MNKKAWIQLVTVVVDHDSSKKLHDLLDETDLMYEDKNWTTELALIEVCLNDDDDIKVVQGIIAKL